MSDGANRGRIGHGVALGCFLNVCFLVILFLCLVGLAQGYVNAPVWLFWGSALWIWLSQLVVVVPAFWIAFRRGRKETAKGILIAAGITALLNGTCWLGWTSQYR